MRARVAALALCGAACLVAPAPLALLPAAAAPAAVSGVMVWGLTPAVSNGDVYAAATRAGCQQSCSLLLRSGDEGVSWTTAGAAGWSGQAPVLSYSGGHEYVIAAGPNGLQVSADGGADFQALNSPSGALDASHPAGGRAQQLLVSVQSGAQYVEPAPPATGQAQALPSSGLSDVHLSWNPAYPHQAAGAPAAYGAGRDPSSKAPVLLRCDATLTCTRATTIVPVSDAARLFISPHVDDDHTILAATRTALLRSTDDGNSFLPVTVLAPRPGTVITTVSDLTFTPDFDAHRGSGRALAAVIAVTQDSNHKGTTYGGVFASGDGAAWSQLGAGSPLDSGAQAVAVTRSGRLVAGWVGFGAQGVTGGIVCSADARTWQPFCPGSEALRGAAAAGASTSRGGRGPASSAPPGAESGAAAASATPAVGVGAAHGQPAGALTGTGASGGSRLLLPAAIAAGILALAATASARLRRRRGGTPAESIEP